MDAILPVMVSLARVSNGLPVRGQQTPPILTLHITIDVENKTQHINALSSMVEQARVWFPAPIHEDWIGLVHA